MRIDRSHTSWLVFVVLATLGCALLFTATFYPHRLPFPIRLPAFLGPTPPLRSTFGGTPLGLILGLIAFAIFLFASALGIRKKKRLWPMGSVQWWLRAHTWLTILTIPLVLFHCGFHLGGRQTTWLMILYVLVMGSGFFGLALQQFMPRLMRERLPREVVFEEIPYFRRLLLESATRLRNSIVDSEPAAVASGAADGAGSSRQNDSTWRVLADFLERDCIPYLAARRGGSHPLANGRTAAEMFHMLRLNVDPRWKPEMDAMQGWCDERRLMDLQTRLQHWLHGWLLLHVPASFALLVFTVWHACVAVSFLVLPR